VAGGALVVVQQLVSIRDSSHGSPPPASLSIDSIKNH
jgi:hypothetical protein